MPVRSHLAAFPVERPNVIGLLRPVPGGRKSFVCPYIRAAELQRNPAAYSPRSASPLSAPAERDGEKERQSRND